MPDEPPLEPKDIDIVHDRANHEDNLHVNRVSLLVAVNGFFAVAVGLTPTASQKLIFSGMILVVDCLWAMWASDAGIFIRKLREAGANRADQRIWKTVISQNRIGPSPTKIIINWMPWVFFVGWTFILFDLVARTPSSSIFPAMNPK
jgi:hypothetical protein